VSRSPDEPSGASACNGSKVTATDRDNASMGSQEPRRIRPYPVSLDTGRRESLACYIFRFLTRPQTGSDRPEQRRRLMIALVHEQPTSQAKELALFWPVLGISV
jgi:hypothetical protein